MAWTTPLTAVASATFTAAQFNASVRDNLLETAPAKATTAGAFFAATGLNTIAQRIPQSDINGTSVATGSTSYTALSGGPAVTVTSGTTALIAVGCQLSNSTAGEFAQMSYAITGATSVAANETVSMGHVGSSSGRYVQASRVVMQGLNAGSNTFTGQYRVSGGSGTFAQRAIAVIPY